MTLICLLTISVKLKETSNVFPIMRKSTLASAKMSLLTLSSTKKVKNLISRMSCTLSKGNTRKATIPTELMLCQPEEIAIFSSRRKGFE